MIWKPPSLPSPTESTALRAFLRERAIRNVLIGLLLGYAAAFAVLLYCYPDPGWGGDSGGYVQSARRLAFSGYRPMGYSWFLRVVHAASDSIHFTLTVQYVLQAASVIVFVLTVLYFFRPRRPVHAYAFALAASFSPGGLLMSRWIMSDPVFMALTLFWLSSGAFLLHRHRAWLLALHLVLMYLAIETRYTGLVYPLISAFGLLWVYRAKALPYAIACLAVLAGAYLHGKHQNTSAVGIDTFSGFSGWALANNATAVIPYIDLRPEEIPDQQLRMIHRVVKAYPDSAYRTGQIMAVKFMWSSGYAGKQVLYRVVLSENMPYAMAWIETGVRLERYAWMLIRQYPLEYLRRFILPNIGQVFYPDTPLDDIPASKLVDPEIKRWYRPVGKDAFTTRYDYNQRLILPVTREVNALIFVGVLALAVAAGGRRRTLSLSRTQGAVLLLTGALLAGYLAMCVLAHPVVMRYLLPLRPMLAALGYMLVWGMLSRAYLNPAHASGAITAQPDSVSAVI